MNNPNQGINPQMNPNMNQHIPQPMNPSMGYSRPMPSMASGMQVSQPNPIHLQSSTNTQSMDRRMPAQPNIQQIPQPMGQAAGASSIPPSLPQPSMQPTNQPTSQMNPSMPQPRPMMASVSSASKQTGPEHNVQINFKNNVGKAREILGELMKKAAQQLQEQIAQPGTQRETHRLRLEKKIEELFSVLDMMENDLRLGLAWYGQHFESRRNVGIPINTKKDDNQPHSIPLQTYTEVVKKQIAAAQELHDLITDTENKLNQASVPPTPTIGPTSAPSLTG